jgi:hypothetical protein
MFAVTTISYNSTQQLCVTFIVVLTWFLIKYITINNTTSIIYKLAFINCNLQQAINNLASTFYNATLNMQNLTLNNTPPRFC